MSAVHFPSAPQILQYLKAHPSLKTTDEKVLTAAAEHFENKWVTEETIIQENDNKSLAVALIDCGHWRNANDDRR